MGTLLSFSLKVRKVPFRTAQRAKINFRTQHGLLSVLWLRRLSPECGSKCSKSTAYISSRENFLNIHGQTRHIHQFVAVSAPTSHSIRSRPISSGDRLRLRSASTNAFNVEPSARLTPQFATACIDAIVPHALRMYCRV